MERPEDAEDYHLTTDLVDQSLQWINRQKATAPDRPFFVYFAPGATHSPHHAPQEWVDKYKGKFEQGWDKLREEIFARQQKLGVIPEGAKLTPRDKSMPAWDELAADEKKVAIRLMEIYAGFLATLTTKWVVSWRESRASINGIIRCSFTWSVITEPPAPVDDLVPSMAWST